MGLFKEFKEFALRGNVIDLAVGVIIGGAFGKITSSLVNDIMMPPLGIVAKTDFQSLYVPLFDVEQAVADNKIASATASLEEVRTAGLPVLAYGSFLTTVLDFVILAFCVFIMVKLMNTAFKRFEALRKQQEKQEVAAKPPELSTSERLLTEIRDSLQARPAG